MLFQQHHLNMFDRGNELKCTLWGVFAQQFNDFLKANVDHGKIMIVMQFAMMKAWDGNMFSLKLL